MRNQLFMILLVFIISTGTGIYAVDNSDIAILENIMAFTGGRSKSTTPQLGLLRDSINNHIANLSIEGATAAELEKAGGEGFQARLEKLVNGNILKLQNDKYYLNIPVITGPKREKLSKVVENASIKLVPLAESMISKISEKYKNNPKMIFHILWSLVIDSIWEKAYGIAFPGESCPQVFWVISPQHRMSVGTNYYMLTGNNYLACTWSENCKIHLSMLQDIMFPLLQVAWGKEIKDKTIIEKMASIGLIDENGKSVIFTYKDDEGFNRFSNEMIDDYSKAVANLYDYKKLGAEFNIPPDELFVIILHETAYSLFDELNRQKKLPIPQILLDEKQDKKNIASLISLQLGTPPGPLDEAKSLFYQNRWHGNPEIIEALKQALKLQPDDIDCNFYLALSLYDEKQYEEAVKQFSTLFGLLEITKEGKEDFLYEWSQLWIAHIYDLTGKRKKAIEIYKKIAETSTKEGTFQMGQYNIGPVITRDWAKERLLKPFKRN